MVSLAALLNKEFMLQFFKRKIFHKCNDFDRQVYKYYTGLIEVFNSFNSFNRTCLQSFTEKGELQNWLR